MGVVGAILAGKMLYAGCDFPRNKESCTCDIEEVDEAARGGEQVRNNGLFPAWYHLSKLWRMFLLAAPAKFFLRYLPEALL